MERYYLTRITTVLQKQKLHCSKLAHRRSREYIVFLVPTYTQPESFIKLVQRVRLC